MIAILLWIAAVAGAFIGFALLRPRAECATGCAACPTPCQDKLHGELPHD